MTYQNDHVAFERNEADRVWAIVKAGFNTLAQMGIRTAVLASYEVGKIGYGIKLRSLKEALTAIAYTAATQSRGPKGKTVKLMDVDKLVQTWIPVVTQMATADDLDEFDEAEDQIDKLLCPILTAPVKQVREFYHKLLAAMKTDRKVPMLVWMGFEAWGAVMVKDAPDEGVKRLKTKLAKDIAELVEDDLKPHLGEVIARALRWRDPEVLQEIKTAVEAGAKPKFKGHESCLFLVVGRGKKKKTVML